MPALTYDRLLPIQTQFEKSGVTREDILQGYRIDMRARPVFLQHRLLDMQFHNVHLKRVRHILAEGTDVVYHALHSYRTLRDARAYG